MTLLSSALIGSTGAVLTGLSWAALIVVSDMWSRSRRLSDHSQRALLPLDREFRDWDLTTSDARCPFPTRASVDTTSSPAVQAKPGHDLRPADCGSTSPRHPRPLCAASRSRVGLLLLGGCIRRMA